MTKRWGGWKRKTKNPWFLRLWRRVYRRNQNYLALVYGEPGSGKTYTCLKLGRLLDPNFSLDNVVFDVQDFFKLLNSGKLKQGSVVIFEELGVAANARRWYSDPNTLLSFINQVFRTRNLIVFYTLPSLELADTQIKRLVHGLIMAMGVDYHTKRNIFKVYDDVRLKKDGEWDRKLITYGRGNIVYKVEKSSVGRIPKWFADAYEAKRKIYENALSKSSQEHLEEQSKKAGQKRQLSNEEVEGMANEVIRNRAEYMDDACARFNLDAVQRKWGVGSVNAKRVKEATRTILQRLNYNVQF